LVDSTKAYTGTSKTLGDRTVIRSLSLGGLFGGGGEALVDVKDGKILRIRPFIYDWKYPKESLNPWKVTRNGVTLEANMRSMISPYSLAYKKRTYSPNRIKYPLIRVDWDPNGERNPQNRGKSKYRRISWDEATDIIASEIKRVHKEYGPCAILIQGDGHGESKTINTPHGHNGRLLEMMGGFTQQVRNPDSWEGWYWGSKHVWGHGYQGMMAPQDNLLKDISENATMCLFWGCDPETTPWGFTGQNATRICYFWKKAGIKQVYIAPDCNYGNAVHADKWIPVWPNTDAALQLAIIYVWVTEDLYDKEYCKTHVVGLEQMIDYVMGRGDDDTPKTPEWASEKCGVPVWTIKALAREIARNTTSYMHYFGGGFIRGPYSHEPGRLECVLLGMQGLGKPGVHQWQISYFGMPRPKGLHNFRYFNPQLSQRLTRPMRTTIDAWGKQVIPKTLIQEAILNYPITFYGASGQESPTEDQFVKYTFPIPKEEGGSEIRMIWTDTPCRIACWNFGFKTVEAFRSPEIEFVLAQHPWLENDCLLADIILPASTLMECEDIITTVRMGPQFQGVQLMEKCIDPIGESKTDYEIVLEIAKKLGYGEQFSENKTIEDLQKEVCESMRIPISWEEMKEKQYYCYPCDDDWEDDVPGLRDFYEDPEENPLATPSGKLEFYSERLAKHFPNDNERKPLPGWIERGETHDERFSSDRAYLYPLLIVSNHGRWRVHSQADDISWTREAPTMKITGPDGYKYEPVWINPKDAAERGIKHGDICKVFNERGITLCGAYVTERINYRTVYVDHGARFDPIADHIDRGGSINTISPYGITSKNAAGQATTSFLVDVQKVTGAEWDEWREKYPEAFARDYDRGAGVTFEAWVVEGGDK
jgi:molybdopterin guanine dinucleotide-containing S/N-oxide reductase-like protein